jgi:uridine kinase
MPSIHFPYKTPSKDKHNKVDFSLLRSLTQDLRQFYTIQKDSTKSNRYSASYMMKILKHSKRMQLQSITIASLNTNLFGNTLPLLYLAIGSISFKCHNLLYTVPHFQRNADR